MSPRLGTSFRIDGSAAGLGRHLGRRRSALRRLRQRRPRMAATLAELVPVAAELVAPVLALERPYLLVVLDLGRIALRLRRETRLVRGGELLLPAGDLVGEPQRLGEQLAQLGPLRPHPREELAAGAVDQVE